MRGARCSLVRSQSPTREALSEDQFPRMGARSIFIVTDRLEA